MMKKHIFRCLLIAGLLVAGPRDMAAAFVFSQATELSIGDEITITVNGQTVIVSGAQGETLEVVSLIGRKVMSIKIDSPAQKIDLNVQKGCYILKVGKVVRKVSLR